MTVGYYRLPDVDGTPKYCQNASEVVVGSCTPWGRARRHIVHDPTATSEALWQYFGVPSNVGDRVMTGVRVMTVRNTKILPDGPNHSKLAVKFILQHPTVSCY